MSEPTTTMAMAGKLPLKRFVQPGRLSLTTIADALSTVPPEQPTLICADELVVDCSLELALQSFDLHVRVLNCPAPACIAFNTIDAATGEARWQVRVGRIEGAGATAFALRFLGLKAPLVVGASATQSLTLSLTNKGAEQNIEVEETARLSGDPLVLVGVLQAARAMRVRSPDEASQRAQWVVEGALGDDSQTRLFAESMQILSLLRSPARQFAVVPYLDRRLYVTQASALVDALEALEADLLVVDERQHELAARKAAAQALLGRVDNAARLTRHLYEQSEANLDASRRLLEQKDSLLKDQLDAVNRANETFEAGLERWKREQILFASLKAALAIGVAVASVCIANPAGAAAGTAAAAEAGAEAAAVAGRIARLIAAIKRIVDAVGGVEKIKAVVEGLNKVREAVAAGISAADLAARIEATARTLPDAGTGVAEEDWDLIVEDLGPLLDPAIDSDVPGAKAYLQGLRKLAIRGKAKFFAQEHVIADAQNFMQMVWSLERGDADRASMASEIEAIAAGEPLQDSLRLRFERARDDIKARVVLAIDNLAAAHHYFALDEGLAHADPAMSTADLRAALGRAADDLVQAFERFDPRPQAWNRPLRIELGTAGRERLAANGAVTLVVPMSDENFPHYGRVRVSQVRAYLRGARCPPGTEILLHLSTSDHYRDRYGSPEPRLFDFAGRPLRLGFGYRHRPGVDCLPLEGDVETSTEVSFGGETIANIDGVYFEPTPFTEWRISLPADGIEKLDLSGCECLELQFSGSAVLSGFRAQARSPAAPGMPDAEVVSPAVGRFDVDWQSGGLDRKGDSMGGHDG